MEPRCPAGGKPQGKEDRYLPESGWQPPRCPAPPGPELPAPLPTLLPTMPCPVPTPQAEPLTSGGALGGPREAGQEQQEEQVHQGEDVEAEKAGWGQRYGQG